MVFETNKINFFMYTQNVNKTLTRTLLQFTKFCSSVSVDFELISVPWETLNVILYGISMLKVNNKNTRKRCEICLKFTKNTRATSIDVCQQQMSWLLTLKKFLTLF